MSALHGLLADAQELDLHDIPSRYPNGLPSGYPHRFYGREMAERAGAAADRLIAVIRAYFQTRGQEEILRPDAP